MSVKLIAENILNEGDFSSAIEQEGEHIGQPEPSTTNKGEFRPLTSGTIADFTYSGTATGVGSTTTIVDSGLCAFGDDYFIGATITFTDSGASPAGNTSGSKTITDFTEADGILTWVGALNLTITGDTFTLTVAFSTREFVVELIDSGDAGDATFKWSHDGGTTYLGRNNPNTSNWVAEKEITNVVSASYPSIVQAQNGGLIVFFRNSGDGNKAYCTISSDNGITWGAPAKVIDADKYIYHALCVSSGRILAFANTGLLIYSDDNGVTWSTYLTVSPNTITRACEISPGKLIGTCNVGGVDVGCMMSNDGGFNWSTVVTISAAANTQGYPTITRAKNGDLVCAYYSDEDVGTDYEIKAKISSDGGATWGSTIDVIDHAGNDFAQPELVTDINGDIYCVFMENTADQQIDFTISTDNGATWAGKSTLKAVVGADLNYPKVCLVDGHQLICAYCDVTNGDIDCVRRGYWATYSANACPCAIENTEQKLICDVGLIWHGGAGNDGDDWTFEAEYEYSMSNLIEDSPSKPWRSEQDNISCQVVLDIGANERHLVDGVGFFGCNLRTFDFELDTASTFTPDDSATVTFDVATGTVDSVTGNAIQDTSLLADYDDHYFAGRYYLRMTSGTDDGETWLIKDNAGDYIFLETTAATNIAAGSPADTFVIFQKHMAAEISTSTPYRYMQADIAAQHTAEDYYQIGTMVAGKTITLSDAFRIGYGKDHEYDIEMLRTPHFGLIPVTGADRRRIFTLEWSGVETTKSELMSLLDHIEGKNIVLIPDDSDLGDCYLVKLVGNADLRNYVLNKFDISITLEEVL